MKKTLSILFLLMLSISVCAQQKDVTRFLGIPVDGSKSEMIRKLKAKGFESNPYDKEVLTDADIAAISQLVDGKNYRVQECLPVAKEKAALKVLHKEI